MHLINSISLLLPQGRAQEDVPRWRRSPRCYQCSGEWPAASLAAARTMPSHEGDLVRLMLREVYSRVTAVHGEQSAAPVPSQQLPIPSSPPAQEAEV